MNCITSPGDVEAAESDDKQPAWGCYVPRARSTAGLVLRQAGTLISRRILDLDIRAHGHEGLTSAKVVSSKCFEEEQGRHG